MSYETVGFLYDNSGVKTAKILSFQSTKIKIPHSGIICRIVPQQYKLTKKYLKKRGRLTGLLIGTKNWNNRMFSGIYVQFKYIKLLLIDQQNKFLGTRVYGKICKEIIIDTNKAILFRRIILASAGYI